MGLTVTAKQSPTLFAQLNARTKRQKARAREATVKSAERVVTRVIAEVARDTNFMADHTRVEFIQDMLGYKVGWFRRFFVGEVNPVTEEVVRVFYPPFVIHGTRFMAGRDVLTPALREERGNYRRAMARALSG